MRWLVLADTTAPPGYARGMSGPVDVVLGCGDLDDGVLLEAAHRFGCPTVLAVKGNHDTRAPFAHPIVDLHQRVVEVGGVRFAGFQGCWKYKPQGRYLYSQEEAAELLARMAPADVLIAHNSPRGLHDRDDGVHPGFEAFHDYIRQAGTKVLFHGHQHVSRTSLLGNTTVVGVEGATLFEYCPDGLTAPAPALPLGQRVRTRLLRG